HLWACTCPESERCSSPRPLSQLEPCGLWDMPAKNGAANNASTTMRARMVSPLARRAEGGALRPQRVCLSIGEPGGRTTRTTPLLLGTLKVALRGGGKLCGSSRGSGRSIATTNCNVRSTVSRARNTASTRLAALSRHENVSGSYNRRKLHEEGHGEASTNPWPSIEAVPPAEPEFTQSGGGWGVVWTGQPEGSTVVPTAVLGHESTLSSTPS